MKNNKLKDKMPSGFLKKISLATFIWVLFGTSIYGQERLISGTVVDDKGESLIGVNIIIKGTSSGTATDIDGNYSIYASPNQSIIFSYTGFKDETVLVGEQATVNIELRPSAASLDEIVIVAYGEKKKSDVISAVTSVDPVKMTAVATTDIGEMLRGQAAGVQITLNDGGPGSTSNILIRGQSSINASNSPLIIVDGVPAGALNDINPNDIASLEVLKDAAAQSLYGARASNGVILITTKRGKAGETKVSYNGSVGTQSVNRTFDIYSGEEFAQLKREAFRTQNLGVYYDDADIFHPLELASIQNNEYINWEDEVLRNGFIQNHNLSVSAGNEKTKIYTSFNLIDQEGVVLNNDYMRFTGRANLDQEVNNWLSVGLNTSFQYSTQDRPNTYGVLLNAITTQPLGQIYNDDGSLRFLPGGFEENKNPIIDLYETNTNSKNRNDILNAYVNIAPFKGFNYKINLSRRSWNGKNESYNTGNSISGITNGGLGSGSIRFQDNVEWQIENIFTYNTKIGGSHNIGLTALQTASESNYRSYTNSASDIPNDILGIYGLEAAAVNNPDIAGSRRALISIGGAINYSYNSKYLLTVSARTDGSSVFGANNKWAFFPSVGGAWNIHMEDFMQNVPVVYNLKLRASYGLVGNQAIEPYGSLSTANQRDYGLGGIKYVGYVPGNRLPNPDLRWETSTKLNVGLDFGLFENRLSGTIEYYNDETTDLLITQSLNAGLGYTERLTNLGKVRNRGIDLSLNGDVVRSKDLNISIGITANRNRNKVLSLYGLDEDGDGIEDDDVGNGWFIGQPINNYFQWEPDGIFQEGEDIAGSAQPDALPGDIRFIDVNGDNIIDAEDRVLKTADADWFGSVNFSVSYKFVDLSANFYTVQGRTRWNNFLYGYTEGGSLRGIKNGIIQDYWLPENPGGNWPRPNESNDPQDIWTLALQDASFVRLQNITLGFTLPEDMLSRVGLSKCRIYATGSNLFTLTDYQSYSPEKNPADYPEAVTIVGGVQLSF